MKRHDSSELPTIYAPRPPSSVESALAEYVAGLEDDRPTLVPCPACGACEPCRGTHLVTPERAAQLRRGEP